MRCSVIQFLGSNCEPETAAAIRAVLKIPVDLVWHGESKLPKDTGLVILPGGFSYGDALRSGALARFASIMPVVHTFAEQGGQVLGICNGFQILLEAGLLKGAMLKNADRKFICKQVDLEVTSNRSVFTCGFEQGRILRMPIAHGEGRYFADAQTIAELKKNDQIVLRYNDPKSPNGSLENIAGIVNETRNVFGLMPHPERAVSPALGSEDGKYFFESLKLFWERKI